MGISSPASARFALDMKGLANLKRSATRNPQAHVREAAQQFEALFLGRIMRSMRHAGFHSNELGNRQLRFYRSLLDRQLAQIMADRGVGLSNLLVSQLSAGSGNSHAVDTTVRSGGVPAQIPLNANIPQYATMSAAPALDQPTQGTNADHRDKHFVHRFMDAAQAAARLSGVSPLLVLAQAALETGWGSHAIKTSDNQDSHNLFAIKEGEDWSGKTTEVATHENVDGKRQQVSAPFRVYDSYRDAFADHVRLIGNSPRYAAVRATDDPRQQARALQACGYATDPHYADKLISVMERIKELIF